MTVDNGVKTTKEFHGTTILFPMALFNRIKELAGKKGWSVNKYVIRVLERECGIKNK